MTQALVESIGFRAVGETTTFTSRDFVNHQSAGVVVTLVTTAIGTGSITLSINGKDKQSPNYYLLLAGAAVTTNTTNRYTVHPGLAAVANVTARDVLPELWRITITHNNANPVDYSVGVCLVARP
jgi:hypothetical protein